MDRVDSDHLPLEVRIKGEWERLGKEKRGRGDGR